MPDSSAIDHALLTLLSDDAQLAAFMPGGVWFDTAPPASKAFVLCSLADEVDVRKFEGRSHEAALYLVKAVILSTQPNAGNTARQAAARIDDLLDGAEFTASGYSYMACVREERLRFIETDDIDPTIRWLHRGGHYRVTMSLNP